MERIYKVGHANAKPGDGLKSFDEHDSAECDIKQHSDRISLEDINWKYIRVVVNFDTDCKPIWLS